MKIKKDKIKIIDVINFGNDLKINNAFTNYCSILFEVENKLYLRTTYGVEKSHEIGKYIYNYILQFLEDTEILGNHLPGSYIGLVKKKNIAILTKKLNKIKCQIDNKEEIICLKIVYYKIKDDDKIEGAIDNVITGMTKIISNDNISVLDFNDSFENNTIIEEKILYSFDSAIKKKEFIPYYQPKVNSKNNTLYGAEALVRWKHNNELISPGEFIPVLEQSGKIRALDFYLLAAVCADIKSWIKQGIKPVKISLNFSRLNFKYEDFAKKILKVINSYNIPTEYIEIEITESIKDNDFDTIRNFIRTMHENNIEVSIDDFGSGYSSIAVLTNFDFDTIKIDKSLVDNMNNRKNYAILSMISNICKTFSIKTVVECVETEKEVILLDGIGFNHIQGYYYDHPLEKKEFLKRLQNKKYKEKKNLFSEK